MVSRYSFAVFMLAAGMFAVSAVSPAQSPASRQEPDSTADLRAQQEANAELFKKFQKDLLTLAQRMERSDKPEDKARAKVLYAALELARRENLESQFGRIVVGMAKGSANTQDLNALVGQDEQLRKVLQEILTILMTDDEATRIKAEIAKLEAFLKEARAIKRNQETIRAMTEAKKGDPNRIGKDQADLADRTKDLAGKMGDGKKSEGKDGDKGIAKADPKPESKPGQTAGDGKADTQESKADVKEPQSGGDPTKSGNQAGSEAKPGGKEGQPSDSKPKPGQEPNGGDQAGRPRDAGLPKSGQPKEGSGTPREGSPKDGIDQQGDPKAGQSPHGSPGSAKSRGQGKGQDKQSQSKQGGDGKGTNPQPQQANQQGSPKGEGQQGQPGQKGQQGQQNQQAQQNQTPGRKQVQEAYPHQQAAADDLKKDRRDTAGKKEDKAIEELAKAIQELEKRLKQLREEEMLKLLANLEARCGRMLAMQIEVYEATKGIDTTVRKNNGQKTTAEIQKAQQQGDKEQEIVIEADRALKLLESEGSAVAFARVLEEVKQDMIAIQRRLAAAYVDQDTQLIEENVIALLKEMVAALKKAQQDIQQQQQQPQQQQQQKPGQKPLIDLIAELKLIRSLQIQVNTRTKMYGEKSVGEQATDPIIQAELRQVAARQAKLQDMLEKIATGSNR